jgi:hypothetical protein
MPRHFFEPSRQRLLAVCLSEVVGGYLCVSMALVKNKPNAPEDGWVRLLNVDTGAVKDLKTKVSGGDGAPVCLWLQPMGPTHVSHGSMRRRTCCR